MGRGVSPTPLPPNLRDAPADPQNRTAIAPRSRLRRAHRSKRLNRERKPSSPRPISTGLLRTLLCFQIRPINLVVYQGSYPLEVVGELISRPASRLDAFSGYPIRT